eukprot:TRINITY_DN41292_c0_g1_i1.p1 TRINITY_DN41292_c0_g1~~TRINITY_DN41292_c0_g1_i1.p1  ORF type:complete len:648 (-),score=109.61 TRINITY_DN41292_c0_g1_i1:114-2057(-)
MSRIRFIEPLRHKKVCHDDDRVELEGAMTRERTSPREDAPLMSNWRTGVGMADSAAGGYAVFREGSTQSRLSLESSAFMFGTRKSLDVYHPDMIKKMSTVLRYRPHAGDLKRPSYSGMLGVGMRKVIQEAQELERQIESQPGLDKKGAATLRHRLLREGTFHERGVGSLEELNDWHDHDVSVDDLAQVLYRILESEDMPNFVENIRLDPDGGLHRIEEIWDPVKFLWFIILLASVVLNAACLLGFNWGMFSAVVSTLFHDPLSLLHVLLVSLVGRGGFRDEEASSGIERATSLALNSFAADAFNHLGNAVAKARFLVYAAFVATFEVCMMFAYLIEGLRHLHAFYNPDKRHSEYTSWRSLVCLVHHTLPRFSTFSALRLMANVHPSLIYDDYIDALRDSPMRATWQGRLGVATWFATTRVLSLLTAMGAFAIKVTALGFKLLHPSTSWIVASFYLVSLMNQCMGSVLFQNVLQDRVFMFVFAGQDTDYRLDEKALRNVYQCRLAKQIWKDFWAAGERLRAVVLLCTLDHYDLQRLLIEDVYDQDCHLPPRGRLETVFDHLQDNNHSHMTAVPSNLSGIPERGRPRQMDQELSDVGHPRQRRSQRIETRRRMRTARRMTNLESLDLRGNSRGNSRGTHDEEDEEDVSV